MGVVHAAVNTTAFVLYGASLIARRRKRGVGIALGLLGGMTATAGGYLGGHLSMARDTGLRATASAEAATTSPTSDGDNALTST